MSAQDDSLKSSESFTFRIQADRRKTHALVSGAHERRGTNPPSVSANEGADVADSADSSAHPT
jgi:hypothetical protein